MSNVVGFKPTPGVISVAGFLYANRSFDVCPIFSLTVGDAYCVFEAVRGFDAADDYSRPEASDYDVSEQQRSSFTFGVPDGGNLTFFGDSLQEQEYRRAIEGLQAMGGQSVEIDFAPFLEAGRMLFNGPVLAERLVDLTPFLNEHLEDLHPATRSVIANAAKFSAADSYRQQYRLRQVQRLVARRFHAASGLTAGATGVPVRALYENVAVIE